MSSRSHSLAGAALVSMLLVTASPVWAQLFGQPAPRQQGYGQQSGDDDADQGLQIERLQNQLRQLTGQNEELQFRNRQLEDQLRQLQAGGAPAGAASRCRCRWPAQYRCRPGAAGAAAAGLQSATAADRGTCTNCSGSRASSSRWPS